MARIVLRIYPQQSHHNATYRLANALKQRGHHIIYVGVDALRQSVVKNGFEFYSVSEQDDMVSLPVQVQNHNNTLFSKLEETIASFKYFRAIREKIEQVDFFSDILRDLKPDCLILDGTFKFFSLQLTKKPVPYFFIETTVSTVCGKNTPPLSSSWVPVDGIFSRMYCKFLWTMYHNPLRPSFRNAFISYCKKNNYPLNMIEFERYFLPGFKNVPEINTSFEQFDYPGIRARDHYYFSPPALEVRHESSCDWLYDEILSKVTASNRKIVLCSFGTMPWRYANHERFIKRLVQAFCDLPDISLILCVESDNIRRELRSVASDNVFLFRRVPQQHLLPVVDAMIMHGGLNSITECILTEVPMLVCPGGKYLDQRGNAGRVKYHGIGLEGSMKNSSKQIKQKVLCLLSQPSFKENIRMLKRRIELSDTSDRCLEFLESFLNPKHDKQSC